MNKIEIENCVYQIHPVYDLYASDKNGNIINIVKKIPMIGTKNNRGYLLCGVRKHGQRGYKTCLTHRFIWECYNGLITNNKVIDHINNIKDDNRICNLQLVTQSENTKKSVKDNDYSYNKQTKNPKCVKATNCETNNVIYFNSIYCCAQHLSISKGTIKRVCDGNKYRKSGISKKDGQRYKFEYVNKENMPDDYIKSANKRPKRVPDEDKKKHKKEAVKRWQQKEYECPKCGKIYKNNYRYAHNKMCK